MKLSSVDILHGCLFALIYNLVSLGITFLVNWCGAEVLILPLLVPAFLIICYLYYLCAKKRSPTFLYGMLVLHIAIVVLCALLSIPFGNAFLGIFEGRRPHAMLEGLSFMFEYFARVFTGLLPPLVHLVIVHVQRRKQTCH